MAFITNPYIAELIGFLGMGYVLTLHAGIFQNNKKITPSFHTIWTCILAAFWIGLIILSKCYLLIIAFAAMRGAFYSPLLNLIRGETILYLHSDPKTGSKFDAWMLEHQDEYHVFLLSCLVAFIIIQKFL